MIVTRGALGGWLLEGGLSAAGSLVDWLARLAGLEPDALMERAGPARPGARGVTVLPWFGGARAPWWRDTARGAVRRPVPRPRRRGPGAGGGRVRGLGRGALPGAVDRGASGTGAGPVGLVLGGGGSTRRLWTEVLTAVTGLPARPRWAKRRRPERRCSWPGRRGLA